jgi:hypothetical protein
MIIIWFDWSDEEIIREAIEIIDTVRIRPIVIVGWEGAGLMPVREFVEIVRHENDTCVVDPRPDLARTLSLSE